VAIIKLSNDQSESTMLGVVGVLVGWEVDESAVGVGRIVLSDVSLDTDTAAGEEVSVGNGSEGVIGVTGAK